jgi:hypothetical protein
MLDPETRLDTDTGTRVIRFTLPRQGVSLVLLSW